MLNAEESGVDVAAAGENEAVDAPEQFAQFRFIQPERDHHREAAVAAHRFDVGGHQAEYVLLAFI
jgi:hypothetical protein